MFVAGFVCKLFSSESNTRFAVRGIEEMFMDGNSIAPWPFWDHAPLIKAEYAVHGMRRVVLGCQGPARSAIC